MSHFLSSQICDQIDIKVEGLLVVYADVLVDDSFEEVLQSSVLTKEDIIGSGISC